MLRQYTQSDYDKFEVIKGRRQCPKGDYSLIKEFESNSDFAASCIFSDGCRFGRQCTFGDGCSFEKGCLVEEFIELDKYTKFEGFGREKRCTYCYQDIHGAIYVRSGCFLGTIAEFREEVKRIHGNNFYGQGYQKAADLMEWQLMGNGKSNSTITRRSKMKWVKYIKSRMKKERASKTTAVCDSDCFWRRADGICGCPKIYLDNIGSCRSME